MQANFVCFKINNISHFIGYMKCEIFSKLFNFRENVLLLILKNIKLAYIS